MSTASKKGDRVEKVGIVILIVAIAAVAFSIT
jgi:cell division protein FtsL